jgi:hypothetical protein
MSPMSSVTPAPYSNTDAAEQDAVNTFKGLIDTRYVKDDIRTRDKVPNVDGIIELVDEHQVPYGKFDVQIRKLPAGHTKYSCPASLVAYSLVSTLPLILVCVDPTMQRAYWRQISPAMPEYRDGQQSFSIQFSDSADTIDATGTYLQKWSEAVYDYRERISKYPELRSEVANRVTLEGIAPPELALLQRYVDAINSALDNDFPVVKEVLYPDVWKLGLGLFSISDKLVHCQLYKIPLGEAAPLVCRLDRSALLSKTPNSRSIHDSVFKRSQLEEPESLARHHALNDLRRVVEQKALPVHGVLASTDILFAFVDAYHRCLGVLPDQDELFVKALDNALNHYMLGVCAAFARIVLRSSSAQVSLDLDWVMDYLATHTLDPIPPSETPIRLSLRAGRLSPRSASEALRYVLVHNVESIVRPLARRTINITPADNWIWSGYTPHDEIHNAKFILDNSVKEYAEFVAGNKLRLPGSVYLRPDVSVIYEYTPRHLVTAHEGPELREYHVENAQRGLPKLSVFIVSDTQPPIDVDSFPVLRIAGQKYRGLSWSESVPDFLFLETPIARMLYGMLVHDLEEHHKLHLPGHLQI